jgi:hypothetical protein
MSNVSSSFKASSWRQFLMSNNALKYSDSMIPQIRDAGCHGTPLIEIFETFSKNPGIGLLCLDTDAETILLLHHPAILGGSWLQSKKKLVALSGFEAQATAIHLKESSIIDVKQKVPLWHEIQEALQNDMPLQELKGKKELFLYKNIVPIPHSLVKTFLGLSQFDPNFVAKSLYSAMLAQATENLTISSTPDNRLDLMASPTSEDNNPSADDDTNMDSSTNVSPSAEEPYITPIICNSKERTTKKKGTSSAILDDLSDSSPWLSDLRYVIYFCYLCSLGKMDHVTYNIPISSDVTGWKDFLERTHLSGNFSHRPSLPSANITNSHSDSIDEDEITVDSSISLKDRHMIHTLLKISENLDQNTIRLAKESEEKSKGFSKLERHKRLLILNATATDIHDEQASEPTEFCKAFLLKTTVYQAKEALQQGLKANKGIVFINSTAFSARLYTVDLLWQSPDQPTGIILFFCAETSSSEFDQGLALLEKIDKADIQRASKQTLEVPLSYSSALWMLKNLRAVMSLYFGSASLTSICLSNWIHHFEQNRVYYRSLQDADPSFLTQVLFAIDRALQIYWHPCGDSEDKRAINSKILQMQDLQNNIEHHNFSYILPRTLSEKFTSDPLNHLKTPPKKGGKKRDQKDDDKDSIKKKQRIEDNHKHWHLKPNENFSELFWKNASKCPKTKNGSIICMKYFIKGFCNKGCNRIHKLTQEEETEFEAFLSKCRSSDFHQGAEDSQNP